MSRNRSGRLALTAVTAAVLAGAAAPALAGPSASQEVPTYQEFKAATYVDADRQYIVNGDEPAATDGDLRAFYRSMTDADAHGSHEAHGSGTHQDRLVVNTVNGRDDVWSASQARNLTYCVSTKFGSDHARIVAAMEQGAALWENASSGVDFVHLPAHDASCTTRNNAVLFSVEPTNTTQYIARAFFPSSPARSQNVLVDDSIWSSGSWEPADILAHELGHTLGFRHEHTRPEAGTCFEDNSWRPLTPYDGASIMHYPQCNGASDDLEFSAYDAQGVRAVYGA